MSKLLEKIGAFKGKVRKLQLWIRKINEDGGQEFFPKLHQYVATPMSSLSHKTCYPFSRNLFHSQAPPEFTSQEEESLIELSCDNNFQTKFVPI
jgi:hypothetical protein